MKPVSFLYAVGLVTATKTLFKIKEKMFYYTSFELLMHFQVNQKRFYTRGTLKGIRISRLAKIPNLYPDWLRSIN